MPDWRDMSIDVAGYDSTGRMDEGDYVPLPQTLTEKLNNSSEKEQIEAIESAALPLNDPIFFRFYPNFDGEVTNVKMRAQPLPGDRTLYRPATTIGFSAFSRPPWWRSDEDGTARQFAAKALATIFDVIEDVNGFKTLRFRIYWEYDDVGWGNAIFSDGREASRMWVQLKSDDATILYETGWAYHHRPERTKQRIQLVKYDERRFIANPLRIARVHLWSTYSGGWGPTHGAG